MMGTKQKPPYHIIDPRIKPLVDAMNATGLITTVASCEGHGNTGFAPYVYFKTSLSVAAYIEQKIREDSIHEIYKLKHSWVVVGVFDMDYDLTFLLHSTILNSTSNSMVGRFFKFFLFRWKIDADLAVLKDLIEAAICNCTKEGCE